MTSGYNIELDSIAWGRIKNNNWKWCMFLLSYQFFFLEKKIVIETNEPKVLEKLPMLVHKIARSKKWTTQLQFYRWFFNIIGKVLKMKTFLHAFASIEIKDNKIVDRCLAYPLCIDKDRWLIEFVQNKKMLLRDYRDRKFSAKKNFPFFLFESVHMVPIEMNTIFQVLT